jgi:hypothetical protein
MQDGEKQIFVASLQRGRCGIQKHTRSIFGSGRISTRHEIFLGAETDVDDACARRQLLQEARFPIDRRCDECGTRCQVFCGCPLGGELLESLERWSDDVLRISIFMIESFCNDFVLQRVRIMMSYRLPGFLLILRRAGNSSIMIDLRTT